MKRIPVIAMLAAMATFLAFAHARSGTANPKTDPKQVAKRAEHQRIQAGGRNGFVAPTRANAGNHVATGVDSVAISKTTWAAVEQTTQVLYGAPTPLPSGIFDGIYALGINDSGQIIGAGRLSGGPLQPIFWASPTGDPTALQTGAFSFAAAQAINNAGQMVGYAGGLQVALLWSSPNASPTVLPNGGIPFVSAFGINDSGQIVGFGRQDSASPHRALFWASPTSNPIPLHADFPSSSSIIANDINNAGQIVGEIVAEANLNVSGPLFWASSTADPEYIKQGDVSSFPFPFGINDAGQIVGISLIPVVWASPAADPMPLPTGGFIVFNWLGINDAGQIVGTGGTSVGPQTGLIWTSVPAQIRTLLNSPLFTNLSPQTRNQLGALLNAAAKTLESGNKNAVETATNQLGAFINAVLADYCANKLTSCQAKQLIDAANGIVVSLGESAFPAESPCNLPAPSCP